MAGFVVMDITQEDYDREIRNKAIDEYTEKLIQEIHSIPSRVIGGGNVLKIAEQMKGGAE